MHDLQVWHQVKVRKFLSNLINILQRSSSFSPQTLGKQLFSDCSLRANTVKLQQRKHKKTLRFIGKFLTISIGRATAFECALFYLFTSFRCFLLRHVDYMILKLNQIYMKLIICTHFSQQCAFYILLTVPNFCER